MSWALLQGCFQCLSSSLRLLLSDYAHCVAANTTLTASRQLVRLLCEALFCRSERKPENTLSCDQKYFHYSNHFSLEFISALHYILSIANIFK